MKRKTIRITTTSANQDILNDFIKPALAPQRDTTVDVETYELDITLIFDADYSGNITVNDVESGQIVSKADAQIEFKWKGKATSILIETSATVIDVTFGL